MSEPIAESFEVSPQQEQLWLAEPDGPSARLQLVLALTGPVDGEALESALAATVARHEILRTTFTRRPGIRVPLQVVADAATPIWRSLDLGSDQLERVCDDELMEPFDLATGSLVRGVLVRHEERRHSLVLTISSLCLDASSVAALLRELAYHCGAAEVAPDDPLQYPDFAAWQRELVTSGDDAARAAGEFWDSFASAEPTALPFAASSDAPFAPDSVGVTLDRAVADSLEAQAASYRVAPAAFIEAAWHVALGRSSGEEDAIVGLIGTERSPELAGALGAFVRPVPVRARVADTVTFAEVVTEVERERNEASERQDYAPAGVQRLCAVGFVTIEPWSARAGELELELDRVVVPGPLFRLWLTHQPAGGELGLRVSFDPRCLAREAVEELAGALSRVLAAGAADPGVEVGSIEILSSDARAAILERFNDTAAQVPASCVHELIAAHAADAPERVAVDDGMTSLTYGELHARAAQLAHHLRHSGVGPSVTVGLCTDRSVDMVVGLLGILLAGGAYVPLNFEHPPARLAEQLRTAGAVALVSQERLLDQLPVFAGEIVCVDRDRAELEAEPATAPAVDVSGEDLAYVMYTSGSTGVPKGVAVTHAGLVNYVTDVVRRLGADREPMTFATVTAISTDLGNTSVFGGLCSGGTLLLASPKVAADGAALAALFDATPVDVLKVTPSHLRALLSAEDPRVLPRRWLVLGGERLSWELVDAVRARSQCAVANHYGPTETTVGSVMGTVPERPDRFDPASVPIGRPIANSRCYVLGPRGKPVPLGVRGSLFIAGAGVARGYAGQPDLTAERFLADPFVPGGRMYDTGDLARWLPDGTLEFLGRSDEQLKIRGYRVEPGEVEAALRSHPSVREAVVVAWQGSAGDPRLAAYCVAGDGVAEADLRAHAAALVPDYMVPATVTLLERLPTTPSGKIDRRALPDPVVHDHPASEFVAPSTPMEQAVADIWAHVLGVERVGRDDDFFALGGHSLLATQVVAQVRSDFAVELPLHSLFSYSTVEGLTAEILQMMGDSEADETARLVAELESLSDEEAERLLAGEAGPPDAGR